MSRLLWSETSTIIAACAGNNPIPRRNWQTCSCYGGPRSLRSLKSSRRRMKNLILGGDGSSQGRSTCELCDNVNKPANLPNSRHAQGPQYSQIEVKSSDMKAVQKDNCESCDYGQSIDRQDIPDPKPLKLHRLLSHPPIPVQRFDRSRSFGAVGRICH